LGVSLEELGVVGAVDGVEVLVPNELAPVEPLEPKLLPDVLLEPKLLVLL
jgi:hypothetical protein